VTRAPHGTGFAIAFAALPLFWGAVLALWGMIAALVIVLACGAVFLLGDVIAWAHRLRRKVKRGRTHA
jgi:hypothetical protein